MLSTLLIFALFISARVYAQEREDLEQEEFQNCLAERGVANQAKWGQLDEERLAHSGACFLRTQKLMKPDGTIDLEFVDSFQDDAFEKDAFLEIYEICKDEIDYEFAACMYENENK